MPALFRRFSAYFRRLSALWARPAGEESEHGAVTALVAILLSGGVLLGMGALVIDVGQLYAEREQLQSGADAASFRVALNCANGKTCTSAAQGGVALTYAQQNANDTYSDVQVCINGTGCPVWKTASTCPPMPTPPAGTVVGNYVEVRTTTRTGTNSTLLPPTLAGALTGNNYKGKTVGACARVNWGSPVMDKVLALGVSLCDWKRMTADGTVFYGPLGSLLNQTGLFSIIGLPSIGPNGDSAIPQVLPLSAFGLPMPSCTTPIDVNVPRGYVWLSNPDLTPPDANCMIDLKVGDNPRSFVLSGLFTGIVCATKLTALRGGPPILLPIFDKIAPEPVSLAPAYHIVGFAPFVVTGYTSLFGGLLSGVGSILGGVLLPALVTTLCGASSCIFGYFTKTLVPRPQPRFGTGPNFGATVIGRTG